MKSDEEEEKKKEKRGNCGKEYYLKNLLKKSFTIGSEKNLQRGRGKRKDTTEVFPGRGHKK